MIKRKGLFLVILSVALAALFTAAQASVENFELKPISGAEKAAGDVIVTDVFDSGYNQKEIAVEASGLEPYSMYTVWLARKGPSADIRGVGVEDYAFKTDGEGKGRFVATISEFDYQKWDVIEIARHPDNNPKNLDNAEIALTGDLG
ncbi:MAG: hypothetical protein HY954_04670 [Deltaproteobacteria bacterium]|nr:hypothetical protein [Deltaproteobacteria bacterium]